jgi:hypothetical protein
MIMKYMLGGTRYVCSYVNGLAIARNVEAVRHYFVEVGIYSSRN